MIGEAILTSPKLSMEAVEPGIGMPDWLTEGILSGRRIMVIYPTEGARKQGINKLHSSMKTGIVDSSHHVTIQRLISTLHIDLRLPSTMEDDGVTFELTHRALQSHAEDFGFPLIQPNPDYKWNRSKSTRILSLHRHLISLINPKQWEDDPGAMTCDIVIKNLEQRLGVTHPARRNRVVYENLENLSTVPFTLRDIEGIIMLDHSSNLSEIELGILNRISQIVNFHQLVNPGSHRLGFHGEYIEDIHPVRKNSNLPAWLPKHEVWVPEISHGWKSPNSVSKLHHIMLESDSHYYSALGEIIHSVDSEVLIVDGDPDGLKAKLSPYLEQFTTRLKGEPRNILATPAVSRLLSIIAISRGEEAWSLTKMRDLSQQVGLPMQWKVFDIPHPENESWSPKLHPKALSEIARSFHVLGGKGALGRWLRTLSNARPRFVGDEKESKALEESQWWIASMARWMSPILSEHDKEVALESCVGCISGKELPLPEVSQSAISWFNTLLEQIDWNSLSQKVTTESHSIPGLQYLVESITRLTTHVGLQFDSNDFLDMIENVAKRTSIPSRRGMDTNLQILSPEQALGVTSDLLILARLGSQFWSMKPQQIPWLDESARMKLGLNRPDEKLRQGRHQLRHLLNSANSIIILDSSLEEGSEKSGPLEEWFTTVQTEDSDIDFEQPPSQLDPFNWHPDNPDRAWVWKTIPNLGLRLVHRVSSMEMLADGVSTQRSGILPRDDSQRAGLAIIENREIISPPLSSDTLLQAAKNEITTDQYKRRSSISSFEVGETYPFSNASSMIRSHDYTLTPNNKVVPEARTSSSWPHLGEVIDRKIILGQDPRPIIPPSTGLKRLDDRIGISGIDLNLPKVWSQSRLQAWLFCPRKAWFENHLRLKQDEKIPEDLAANARGNIVHQMEEAVLRAHGLEGKKPVEIPVRLTEGPIKKVEDAWNIVLTSLVEKAPWMKRLDGVSAHRCRDLIGVSPEMWNDWLGNESSIPVGGRLGRMIESDYEMSGCAPIASEWELSKHGKTYVEIILPSSPELKTKQRSFRLSGFIDRVDQLIIDYDYQEDAELVPLDIDIGDDIPTSKLVVIRDIKSMDGPKDDNRDKRHIKGLFDELQLALYARAWEIGNPGHRVVGVGVTQVGSNTKPWMEIDPEFIDTLEDSNVGITTQYLANQYRRPGESESPSSNPFRAWMRERITTALRVIENAEAGKIPCNCKTLERCKLFDGGGY